MGLTAKGKHTLLYLKMLHLNQLYTNISLVVAICQTLDILYSMDVYGINYEPQILLAVSRK